MAMTISSIPSTDLMDTVRQITQTQKPSDGFSIGSPLTTSQTLSTSEAMPSFGDMLSNLVNSVDKASKTAQADARAVMMGKSDNIHQAMLSMQEASVAFSMMSEVRNKLVGAYQELMRMQV